MSEPTPNVPYRMELVFDLPGTPEQVWAAIATANGISAWMTPTDLEERQGGAVSFHMGDTSSDGTITGWEPPRRLVYEEPDWAELTGHGGAPTTPLVSEFLIEATSGGTCVLKVVTSGFGVGADWEREFFDEMVEGWTPAFDTLRLYLLHFPGQQVRNLEIAGDVPAAADTVFGAMRRTLGAGEVGDVFDGRGHAGVVERVGPRQLVVRITDPVPGFLNFVAWDKGDGSTSAMVNGHLFSDEAEAYVEQQAAAWREWLDALVVAG